MTEHRPSEDMPPEEGTTEETTGTEQVVHTPGFADIGRAVLSASSEAYDQFSHPELTREQERRMFELLRDASPEGVMRTKVPIDVLRNDKTFLQLITTQGDSFSVVWWKSALARYETASDVIIACYQRAILPIVGRFKSPYIPFEDRIAGGNEGLLHALKRYDVDTGNRFLTMAIPWVVRGVRNEIAEQYGITLTILSAISTARSFAHGFQEVFGRKPKPDELRTLLIKYTDGQEKRPKVTVPSIDEALAFIRLYDSYGPLTHRMLETIPSESVPAGEKDVPAFANVQQAIAHLEPRHQRLIAAQYGLGEQDLAGVLEELQISEEQAQTELAGALAELQRAFTANHEHDNITVTSNEIANLFDRSIPPDVQSLLDNPTVMNREKILALARLGRFSLVEMGKILNITREAVRQVIEKAGGADAGYLTHRQAAVQVVEKLLRGGYTAQHAAKVTGVNVGTVRRSANRLRREEKVQVATSVLYRAKIEETPDMLLFKQWLMDHISLPATRFP